MRPTELFYLSQSYYRISQLHSELKFIQKAESYMQIYEKLQSNYLSELEKEETSEIVFKIGYLQNQLQKRKAWLYHLSCDDIKAISILTEVYSNERKLRSTQLEVDQSNPPELQFRIDMRIARTLLMISSIYKSRMEVKKAIYFESQAQK